MKLHVASCKYLENQPWSELRLQYLRKFGVKGAEKMTLSEQDMRVQVVHLIQEEVQLVMPEPVVSPMAMEMEGEVQRLEEECP